jgi:hypothetical protein
VLTLMVEERKEEQLRKWLALSNEFKNSAVLMSSSYSNALCTRICMNQVS